MSAENVPVTIEILDKEYVVACPLEERDALLRSALMLDQRMRQVREGGKVLGTERMAVITALNLVHELRQQCDSLQATGRETDGDVRRIAEKARAAVGRRAGGAGVD